MEWPSPSPAQRPTRFSMPQTPTMVKQCLPLFPDFVTELTSSWSNCCLTVTHSSWTATELRSRACCTLLLWPPLTTWGLWASSIETLLFFFTTWRRFTTHRLPWLGLCCRLPPCRPIRLCAWAILIAYCQRGAQQLQIYYTVMYVLTCSRKSSARHDT